MFCALIRDGTSSASITSPALIDTVVSSPRAARTSGAESSTSPIRSVAMPSPAASSSTTASSRFSNVA